MVRRALRSRWDAAARCLPDARRCGVVERETQDARCTGKPWIYNECVKSPFGLVIRRREEKRKDVQCFFLSPVGA